MSRTIHGEVLLEKCEDYRICFGIIFDFTTKEQRIGALGMARF